MEIIFTPSFLIKYLYNECSIEEQQIINSIIRSDHKIEQDLEQLQNTLSSLKICDDLFFSQNRERICQQLIRELQIVDVII